MSVRIINGDMLQVLPQLSAEGFQAHSCVTDPPYHLVSIHKRFAKSAGADRQPGTEAFGRLSRGFMGKTWDGGDIAMRPETWRLVFNCLRPGAFLVAFGGTRTWHRQAVAIEDAGFEIRDTIMWLYGSGFPKSHDVSKGIDKAAGTPGVISAIGAAVKRMIPGADQDATGSWAKDNGREYQRGSYSPSSAEAAQWSGWGTALKPAVEPIILARKPLAGTVAANVLAHGCGALNIDACRVEGGGNKKFERAPGSVSREQYRKGTTVGPAISVEYGRWPANVIHDGSDEVEAAFAAFGDGKGQSGLIRGTEPSVPAKGDVVYGFRDRVAFATRDDTGTASRFFYSAKADAADRAGSKHPTVKPTDLMRYLVQLVTAPGGTVLDPFAGTGSTGLAADQLGMNAVLVEQDETYASDAGHKVSSDAPLFASAAAE